MGSIDIKNVTKKFGDTTVLNRINLSIKDGEFLILVGPSGCGKSTLMNTVAGLEDVTSGQISIAGTDVTGLSPKDRDIAMVFQSYALYPTMNVRRNISFGLEMRKVPKVERNKMVDSIAELLQISHLLDRKPSQLSGGQRQRVAMGRALARSPKVFLFDEPLSNLDAKLRVEMRLEIKKMHKRLGTTIIYVTHDQIEAMTLADRIAVLSDGIVQQFGTPYEIYNDPHNRFVADFMGSPAMNFIECEVKDDRLMIESDGQQYGLKVPDFEAVKKSGQKKIVLGIRPEMITEVKPEQQGQYIQDVNILIEETEPMGADTMVIGQWNGTEIQGRVKPEAGVFATMQDRHTRVHVDTRKAVLFHPETGARIR